MCIRDRLIPSMVSLIERKIGQDKAIPQMLLVGASADDTIDVYKRQMQL